MSQIRYKDAGVDILAGNEAVHRIKPLVEKTFSRHVCTEIGSFGALFDLKELLEGYKHPVLVQSIDGVGTKTNVARQMNKFDSIGIDLVSATTNDILVMGARPLTLLDYIAADKLHPAIIEEIVRGMAQACHEHGISLIGGETAEMPGTYQTGEHDLVGIVTGIVEKERIINGKSITPGDVIYGVGSSGLHTNGYSLARKLFFEVAGLNVDSYHPELQSTVGEALLKPHLNYTHPILHCLEQAIVIKGMAHITGGGLTENIPRILPESCSAFLQQNAWERPPLFSVLQQLGKLELSDMVQTFNMGIGLIIILDEHMGRQLETAFKAFPEFSLRRIGLVFRSDKKEVRIE